MIRRWIFYFVSLCIIVFGMKGIAQAVPIVTYDNSYDSVSNLWTYDATIFNGTQDILFDFVIYPTAQPLSGADQTGIGWGGCRCGKHSPLFCPLDGRYLGGDSTRRYSGLISVYL